MRSTSKLAISMALSVIVVGGFAADASAQSRRNRDAATPAPTPAPAASRGFIAAYRPVNEAITAGNWAVADAALPALRAAATSPYEQFIVAQTDFRIASNASDAARQLVAADAMADSNGAPAADAGRVFVAAGQLAFNAGNFPKAVTRFQRATELGATSENLPQMLLTSMIRANQIDGALTLARQQIATARTAGQRPAESIYSQMALALQEANRDPELITILTERASDYPTAFNFRSLGLIYLQNAPNSRATTLDVMRLLTAAGAMTDRANYLEYAGVAAEEGLPNEAADVVLAARASGLVTPTDTTFNEIYDSQRSKIAEDRGSLAAAARRAESSTDARVIALTGDAFLSYGDTAQALAMYAIALTKPGVNAGVVNTHVGIAQARAGNNAAARTAFEAVTGDSAPIARMWLAWLSSRTAAAAAPAAAPAAPPAASPAASPAPPTPGT